MPSWNVHYFKRHTALYLQPWIHRLFMRCSSSSVRSRSVRRPWQMRAVLGWFHLPMSSVVARYSELKQEGKNCFFSADFLSSTLCVSLFITKTFSWRFYLAFSLRVASCRSCLARNMLSSVRVSDGYKTLNFTLHVPWHSFIMMLLLSTIVASLNSSPDSVLSMQKRFRPLYFLLSSYLTLFTTRKVT